MTRPAHRRALAATAALIAAGMLVASCSSEPEPAATATLPSEIAVSESDSGSSTPIGDPNSAAGLACAAYFELDLLNSTYAGGAVADGDMTEEEVKAKFGKLLKELVAQAQIAVSDGTADEKLLANAERMRNTVKELAKKQTLADLTDKDKELFAVQSLRVQRSCARAGFELPADNVTARTAAGL